MKKIPFTTAICCFLFLSAFLPLSAQKVAPKNNVIDVGSRLELFIDDFLIEKLAGQATRKLHQPIPKEIAIVHDELWEGSGSGYHSVFKDGDTYKMYYKAWQHEASSDKSTYHPLYCAYAESKDGIHWTKPNLGLHEFNGSKNNNIVFTSGPLQGFSLDAGHPAVFKDENPNVSPDARYKAVLISGKTKRGLVAFKSPDGINWTLISDQPIITNGAFDSQNLAFWDPVRKEYRAYWRYFSQATGDKDRYKGTREIRTATSSNFIDWKDEHNVVYVDSPQEELYTNQIKAYHRAPHIFIGFPARYVERGWSESMRKLPELEEREKRAAQHIRYGTALTETLIMSSRDGVTFNRWNEAFMRPGMESNGTWTYGDQYMAWHVVETKSDRAGAPNELSLYSTENYWKGQASHLRRYTLRLDGFASVNAPRAGGELITKTLTFKGNELILNFSSAAAGDIKVEILDEKGKPIPGYSLDESSETFGDAVNRAVHWKKNGTDVSALQGKKVKLRFVMKDADLYSFKFQ
ncbi:hypothetical protein ACFPMF_19305 [Larkinella bovis]|uniref:Glycosyl hydrolase family 32 n=1 Tax=Larkinella bovis TaxID=683041 RepID=A0ABW0ID92_9BACT